MGFKQTADYLVAETGPEADVGALIRRLRGEGNNNDQILERLEKLGIFASRNTILAWEKK